MNLECPECGSNEIICAVCGHVFRPAEFIPMTEAERLVFETLRDLRTSLYAPVATNLIADFVGYSSRWTRQQLNNLARAGVLHRPKGERSGWVEQYAIRAYQHISKHYILEKTA
jgi:rubredoxin